MKLEQILEADWVKDMHAHFAKHGFYRSSDLERLLGKPWVSVIIDENGCVQFKSVQPTDGEEEEEEEEG